MVTGAISLFLLGYTLLTLFPFYVLFVRTFVGTRDATTLHLWAPRAAPISLDAEIGNLAVFYNLDLRRVKTDLGIPPAAYLGPRTTLRQAAAQYQVPVARIERYFAGFSTFNGWITLLGGGEFWQALGRTLLVTAASLIGINLLSLLTGYGLAGLRRRDQMFVYNLYLLQMVIPAMLVIIPKFLIVQWLVGLVPGAGAPGLARGAGQLIALVLINIKGGALSTMVFTSAIGALPRELEESAQMDGAGRFQYFRHVLLPLMKVPIATLTVILLPQFWNQFLEPYVYLDPANTTALPLIQNISGQYSTNFQMIYTGVFVSILPLVLVYLIFRRLFIQSVLAGAVKG